MRFRVLGPVEIEADDGQVHTLGRRQERCLLAILLLEAGRVVPVDRLCQLLWDDNPPEQARRAVHAHVARIRAALTRTGGVELLSQRDGYLLRVDPDSVDAHRFRTLISQATGTADPVERDRLLGEALRLWRGPALYKATTSDRLRQRLCADLEEQRLQALEEATATGLALGRHRELLGELARLGAEHPLRERLVELHMLALYRCGRTAEALDVYQRARTRLADELGLDPGTALQQLQQAVLRGEPRTEPKGTPVPAESRVTPAQLPADLPSFTGRSYPLRQLDALLPDAGKAASATAVVISAIAGTPGVGKTALAVHWAHRVQHRFPDGQLYANLRGFNPGAAPTPPARVVRGFLDALNVPAQRIPTEPDAQIGLYRSLLADRRVLVLLDNARDADQVRPLLPGAPGCVTVVTSRNLLTSLVAIEGARPLTLDLLSADEARQLLTARLGEPRVAAEPAAVAELIELCARLPLALAIAAARAATEPDLALAAINEQLRAARGTLNALAGEDTASDVRAVFSWSYHTLTPAAARLFRLLGLHPGPDLSAAAAASLAGLPLEPASRLLAELTRAHLVREPVPGRYACHDLLRVYATEQARALDPQTEQRAALHRLLDHYLHTAHAADALLETTREPITLAPAQPGVSPEPLADHGEAMAWFSAEHAVLVAAVGRAEEAGFDTHVWQLAWTLTVFLDWRGLWDDCVAAQEAAVGAAGRVGDRHGQAVAHRLLASTYLRLGREDEALTHLGYALDLLVALDDRGGQARTHLGMVRVLERVGRDPEALAHAQRALDLNRATGHTGALAIALNAVGYLQSKLGNHDEALAHCRQALALHQERGERYGEANTWDSIGHAHHHLGQYAAAVTCYQRALDIFHAIEDRHSRAATLRNLGETYAATGDRSAARDAWQQAVDILVELNHPDAEVVRAKLQQLS
jgi:DNA-binding SARP family transcriptional activator/predicted negative regulator of RcsB-dependent stress response